MAEFIKNLKKKVEKYKTKAEEIRAAIEEGAETIRDIRADVEDTVEDLKADSEEKMMESLEEIQKAEVVFKEAGYKLHIETNGTITPPNGIDWICVSPKMGSKLILTSGDELKLVYPQPNGDPAQFRDLQFDHFSLQPMDGPNLDQNTEKTLSYCRQHPYWNVSLQTHKFLGIP